MGNVVDAHGAAKVAVRVEDNRVVPALAGDKGPNLGARAGIVDAHRDQRDTSLFVQVVIEFGHRVEFVDAGFAPCSPEADNHGFAFFAEAAQLGFASVELEHRYVWKGLRRNKSGRSHQ